MRTIVISDVSHTLLAAHSLSGALLGGRRLRDGSWEIEVDEDIAFCLDQLGPDPDKAIFALCTTGVGHA